MPTLHALQKLLEELSFVNMCTDLYKLSILGIFSEVTKNSVITYGGGLSGLSIDNWQQSTGTWGPKKDSPGWTAVPIELVLKSYPESGIKFCSS